MLHVLPHVEPTKVRASAPYIILKGDSDSKRCFFQSVHCRRGKCYGAGGVASLRPVLLKFYHAPLLLGAGARQGPCLRKHLQKKKEKEKEKKEGLIAEVARQTRQQTQQPSFY